MKHPTQPFITDDDGVIRFKENKIIRYILDNGNIGLNDIIGFSNNDQQQVAQLMGYSVSGYGDLSYVSKDNLDIVDMMCETGKDEKDCKIEYLENKIEEMRDIINQLADFSNNSLY